MLRKGLLVVGAACLIIFSSLSVRAATGFFTYYLPLEFGTTELLLEFVDKESVDSPLESSHSSETSTTEKQLEMSSHSEELKSSFVDQTTQEESESTETTEVKLQEVIENSVR